MVLDVAMDVDLFSADLLRNRCWRETAGSVLFVDSDLLLKLDVAALLVDGDGGREGFVKLFVTFPSDVRSLRR